jgi:alginate O-acetyltransferase complex protein AlgI
MLFNSFEFAIFLPIVFIVYWFVLNRNLKIQNFFLLVVSYIFYGWWDWRFLSLIIFSTGLDFWVGLQLRKIEEPKYRRLFFGLSCLVNLGFLGVFKYFNFFVDTFVGAFAGIGVHLEPRTLNVVLPVGISFYTFQSLSYAIDVYRRKLQPTKDIIAFFAFISFFPQLVAGPIERATNLLPQFYVKRTFDYDKARDGMRQMLWGIFKKIVIADNCAASVNYIFDHYTNVPSSALVLGAFLFAFQIYCDFSGYSDIAIGSARLFGFRIMRNFAYPYFSRDIAEFWRRWHISLSTWFRDYVYIPLGGSRGTFWQRIRNTIVIFTVSGFWHGANWTFVGWGFLNGLYFLPLLLTSSNRKHTDSAAQGKIFPSFIELVQMCSTFTLVNIGWILFRSKNVTEAFHYIGRIFSPSLFTLPQGLHLTFILPLIAILITVEWIQRDRQHGLQIDTVMRRPVRWCIYQCIILLILLCGSFTKTEFIYFAF